MEKTFCMFTNIDDEQNNMQQRKTAKKSRSSIPVSKYMRRIIMYITKLIEKCQKQLEVQKLYFDQTKNADVSSILELIIMFDLLDLKLDGLEKKIQKQQKTLQSMQDIMNKIVKTITAFSTNISKILNSVQVFIYSKCF